MPIATSTMYSSPTHKVDAPTLNLKTDIDDEEAGTSMEFTLLNDHHVPEASGLSLETHDISTAPLISRQAMTLAKAKEGEANTQYGLMGSLLETGESGTSVETPADPRLYLNTNAPFSALVCGVQGSGKSHTVSVMLENMFITGCAATGTLKKPLAGLVLHFGEGGLPCEAAWAGMPQENSSPLEWTGPSVRIFVSSSSLNRMKEVYAPLGNHVVVEPLLFDEEELDAQAFLSMMAIGSSEGAPLYMQAVLAILRELGESYTYKAFSEQLEIKKSSFNPQQLSGLEQRLSLLKSFTKKKPLGKAVNGTLHTESRFAAGQLTIIDLSDPFIDSVSACGLFEILIRLFVRADLGTGKVLLVDEAHKYLSSTRGASGLTQAILRSQREQRHQAMRVIISTQEPTVVPAVIIDLCSVVFLHRFSSPSWWDHITKHVSANFSNNDRAFDKVVTLKTGQAIVLAPSALDVSTSAGGGKTTLRRIGRRYMLVKTRKRVTHDGGASILVLS